MKKKIIFSLALLSTAALTAFATVPSKSAEKAPKCYKVYLTNPCGIIYYKCVTSAGEDSPDCWYTGNPNINGGCNITLRPGC